MARRTKFTNGVILASGRPSSANSGTETVVLKIKRVTVTFNPASVAAATSAEQTLTVTGAEVGDIVLAVNKPSVTAGVGIGNARVSAANTVALTFINATAGAVDPGSESYEFVLGTFATS